MDPANTIKIKELFNWRGKSYIITPGLPTSTLEILLELGGGTLKKAVAVYVFDRSLSISKGLNTF